MAGEARRSGRATKGQHRGLDANSDATPKSTKKGQAKTTSKKAAEPTPSGDEETETIRCVCGDTRDDIEGREFIACDACEVWQHNVCMDIHKVPDHYFCEVCHPEDHKELLAAIARGEKPWEERIKAKEEADRAERNRKKSAKRKSKGGSRQSRVSDVKSNIASEAVSSSPAPAASSQSQEPTNKRKFEEEEEEEEEEGGESAPSPIIPDGDAKQASPPAPVPAADGPRDTPEAPESKRRKSNAASTTAPQKPDVETAIVNIEELPKDRRNVALAFSPVIADGIRDRSRGGKYRIPDGHTADSLGKYHSSRIEYALFMNHGGPSSGGNYGLQFRSILANIKKNRALIDRLLSGTLTADELSTMSSQDMASEELQKQRAAMKEEADKQAVMIQEDDKPRVRRTHKGEEVVDDDNQNHVESVFAAQPVRHRESAADVEMSGTAGSPPRPENGVEHAGSPTTRSGEVLRRESSNFDINAVWAKTQASETPLLAHPPRRRSSVAQSQPPQATHDADIDRMLADDPDDEYQPPDSKGEFGDPTIAWRGPLIQPGVTDLLVNARFVAGNDFSRPPGQIPWSSFIPSKLEIEGRLAKAKADEYLCGLQWSRKSDVAVLALSPYDNELAFNTIFDYFHSRGRYAVAKKAHGISPLVKDLYITPVEAGTEPPPHMGLLDHCELAFPVGERSMLATFVVNRPSEWGSPPSELPQDSPAVPSVPPFTPTDALSDVDRILGPLATSPSVQELLRAAGGVLGEQQLLNLRHILERDERARYDLNILNGLLLAGS